MWEEYSMLPAFFNPMQQVYGPQGSSFNSIISWCCAPSLPGGLLGTLYILLEIVGLLDSWGKLPCHRIVACISYGILEHSILEVLCRPVHTRSGYLRELFHLASSIATVLLTQYMLLMMQSIRLHKGEMLCVIRGNPRCSCLGLYTTTCITCVHFVCHRHSLERSWFQVRGWRPRKHPHGHSRACAHWDAHSCVCERILNSCVYLVF